MAAGSTSSPTCGRGDGFSATTWEGPDGIGAICDFLSALRRHRWPHAVADKSGFDASIGKRLGRDRGRARCVSDVFSDGGLIFLFPIFFSAFFFEAPAVIYCPLVLYSTV